MSDLVRNPEDRFSRHAAHNGICSLSVHYVFGVVFQSDASTECFYTVLYHRDNAESPGI